MWAADGWNVGGFSSGEQQVFVKMSQGTSRRYKVSVSATVLPARCGDMEQQLDHNLPVLHAKSKVNRQNLCLLLKWVPSGVQTLNDLQFIHPARRRRWKFVQRNVSPSSLYFSVPPTLFFFSHLFSTLTSFYDLCQAAVKCFMLLLLSSGCRWLIKQRLHGILGARGPLSS